MRRHTTSSRCTPTPEERAGWKAFLDSAIAGAAAERDHNAPPTKNDPLAKLDKRLKSQAETPRERAYEDLFWALLNSSEMALQH